MNEKFSHTICRQNEKKQPNMTQSLTPNQYIVDRVYSVFKFGITKKAIKTDGQFTSVCCCRC